MLKKPFTDKASILAILLLISSFSSLIMSGCGGKQSSGISRGKLIDPTSLEEVLHCNGIDDFIEKLSALLENNAFALNVPFERSKEILLRNKEFLKRGRPNLLVARLNEVFENEFLETSTGCPISHLYAEEGKSSWKTNARSNRDSHLRSKHRVSARILPQCRIEWKGDIPVLIVPSFEEKDYSDEIIARAITSVKKSRYLLIDLRDDLGGSIDKLDNFMSHFINPQTEYAYLVGKEIFSRFDSHRKSSDYFSQDFANFVKSIKNSQPTARRIRASSGILNLDRYQGQIFVLINESTLSAAEVVAAALQEVGAIIVGEQSGAQVLEAKTVRFSNGVSIHYPISEVITSKEGRRLEGTGISPTYGFSVGNQDAIEFTIQYINDLTPNN